MAQIQKGTTYSTGDQVTATNLNALADAAILLPGAITDQTAKTVPLAADTVLIHSAADTALRKSTLTQLFANATGIPISTGISGLGTGIATALAVNTGSAGAPVLFNGALGTPASGTVTNLTGTASININGTVGATTPSTVAATTGTFTATGQVQYFSGATTASKYIRLENTGGNSYFGIEGATPAFGGTAYAAFLFAPSEIDMLVGSVKVGAFTATGLNSTPIGVTTASTGAFTTLSASGLITSTVGNNTTILNSASATTGYQIFNVQNTSGRFQFGIEASVGGNLITGSTPYAACLSTVGNKPVQIGVDQALIGSFSSTGLAVTGGLSTTGNVTVGSGTSVGLSGINIANGASNYSFYTASDNTKQFIAGIDNTLSFGKMGMLSSHDLAIVTNNAARIYITSSGNVGIGQPSPAYRLDIADNSTGIQQRLLSSSTSGTSLALVNSATNGRSYRIGSNFVTGNGEFALYDDTAGATRITVSSTGNVGIGTSSPTSALDIAAPTAAVSVGSTTGTNVAYFKAANTGGNFFIGIDNSSGSSFGAGTYGRVLYSAQAYPMAFFTNDVERMRLDSAGRLSVGAASSPYSAKLGIVTSANQYTIVGQQTVAGSYVYLSDTVNNAGNYYHFVFLEAGTYRGGITSNGSVMTYGGTSDYRLKNIIGPLTDSGAFIDALKPKIGTWKSNGSKFVGFLAHEFAEISPSSVVGEKDEVDHEGKPKYQSMQASSAEVIANLVAQIQELRQRMAAVEGK